MSDDKEIHTRNDVEYARDPVTDKILKEGDTPNVRLSETGKPLAKGKKKHPDDIKQPRNPDGTHVRKGLKANPKVGTMADPSDDPIVADTLKEHAQEYIDRMGYKPIIELLVDRIANEHVSNKDFHSLAKVLLEYTESKPTQHTAISGTIEHNHTHEHKKALEHFDELLEAQPAKNPHIRTPIPDDIIDGEILDE